MGAASEIEELLGKDARRRAWLSRAKYIGVILSTFAGTFMGGAYAVGAAMARVERDMKDTKEAAELATNRAAEAYKLALDAKTIAVTDCHRLDGKFNERFCP